MPAVGRHTSDQAEAAGNGECARRNASDGNAFSEAKPPVPQVMTNANGSFQPFGQRVAASLALKPLIPNPPPVREQRAAGV